MMKIHRESIGTLVILMLALALIDNVLLWLAGVVVFNIFIILSVLFFLLIALFFRSPERQMPDIPNSIISPADGKIIIIEKVFENEFMQKEMLKVSIFMSIWNVHLNRIPLNGKVVYQKYHPGKYLVAFHEKSSEKNERNTVVIEDKEGRFFLIRQIAGAVARRIKCYTIQDHDVMQGDELGFIKFGSRVDLFMPPEISLKVKIGDIVFGRKSLIAVFE